jgi:hypothetical protein
VSRREHRDEPENWINNARRRLAERRRKKPETKAGQIRALWPEISAAIEDGQSMKSIRLWLEEEAGVILTGATFRSYVRRCRGKEAARRNGERLTDTDQIPRSRAPKPAYPFPRAAPPARTASRTTPAATDRSDRKHDPMAAARKALNRSRFDIRKVHNDGDPTDRNLI